MGPWGDDAAWGRTQWDRSLGGDSPSQSRRQSSDIQEKGQHSLTAFLTSRDRRRHTGHPCLLPFPITYYPPHHFLFPIPPYQASYLNAASAWRKATSSREPSVCPASQQSVPVLTVPPHRKLPKSRQQPIPLYTPSFITRLGPEQVLGKVSSFSEREQKALEAGRLLLSRGEVAGTISLGRWVLVLSPGELTCRRVLETSSS